MVEMDTEGDHDKDVRTWARSCKPLSTMRRLVDHSAAFMSEAACANFVLPHGAAAVLAMCVDLRSWVVAMCSLQCEPWMAQIVQRGQTCFRLGAQEGC